MRDLDLDVEVVRAAVAEQGNIDRAATILAQPKNRFRVFCRTHGISASGSRPVVVHEAPDEVLLQENRDLKKRIRRYEEQDIQAERALRRLEKAVADNRPRYTVFEFKSATGKRTPQEMVLLASDFHGSEVVRLEATNGINEYGWEIMLERMRAVQQGVLSHKEHFGFEVSGLTIPFLGDLASGDIHEELAITNDRPAAETVVDLAYDLAEWLLGFTPHFPVIHLKGVPGNHPRHSKKPSFKQYHNNGDWLIYQMVAMLLKDHPQFTFEFPRSAFSMVMLADRWRVLLMHGDGIRSTMPGVPWGGVHRRITTLEAQMTKARTPLDFVFMGHWHSSNSLDGIQARTIMNGSLKGADEYSLQQFGSGRDASQTLMTFHKQRGLTGIYPLDLQGVTPASEGWS